VANRTVKVTIEAAVTGAIANVRAFGGAVKGLGTELDVLGRKHEASYNKIASTTGKIGIGLAVGFGLIIKSAMDFDKEMSAVGSVADASASQLEGLRQAALNAGRDTAFTATQAATAEEELAKAGISTADILGGALKGSLALAAAGSVDLATAATISAQAMNQFGLAGKDVGHIADVLTAGANKSATDVQGLGYSLSQVGGIAHMTGLSLEDTTGVLAAFAQQGLVGEEAGTTLKQMLLKLEAPSGKAADEMQHLGINIYDTTGQFIGITGVAQQLTDALGKLDPAQRNAAMGTIFGARAIRGATVLYKDGADGIQQWISAVNDSGAAQRAADARLNNLSGDLHKLLGSLQAVAVSASGGANAGLRDLAQGAEKTVNAFLGLPKPVQETAVVLLGISAAGLLATSGLLKARKAVLDTLDAMRAAGPLGTKFASGLTSIGKIGGGLALVGVAALGAYEGIKALGDWMSKSSKPVARDIDALTASLKEFAATGAATGDMAKIYGTNLQKLGDDMKALAANAQYLATHNSYLAQNAGAAARGPAAYNLTQAERIRAAGYNQATVDVKALDAALSQLAQNGGASQAYMAFVKISDALRAQGIPLSQINSLFPQYAKAAQEAASANTGFAQGSANAATQLSILDKGMQDAIDHGESFKTVWDELNGALLNTDQAALDANKAIEDVTKTLKNNRNAWQGNSDAALEDRIAVAKAAQSAAFAAQMKYQETGSVDEANAVYQKYIGQLRAAMLAAGMNKRAVDELLSAYAQMPSSVGTTIHSNAQSEADRIQGVLNKLGRINGYVATYNVQGNYIQTGVGKAAFAAGGVTVAAASGLATAPAGIYPPQRVGSFIMAEARTGGETLIPNYGIPAARGLALADYAASHYGGRVMAGGGGPMQVTLNATFVTPSGEVWHRQVIRYALDTNRSPADLWPASAR
jgi:TP901 family phage tail tape measure protein